jgi:small-conductance mechanosensitive channel
MLLAQTRPGWVEQLDDWHLLTGARIILILVLAIVLTWIARRAIRRTVSGMHTLHIIGGKADRRVEQRARTITRVLRSVVTAVIWTVAIIAILPLVGVNVTAFVAATSIIGGALAFGAQQVVRDLLAGFFMFTENQYGVGDNVDLGLAEGTVEDVSLRVTRLRGADGKVWYVPHGQITRVANLSQEWAQVVVDVPVPRTDDVEADVEALTATVAALHGDPTIGPELLDEPQVLGVQALLDDRMLLRVAVRTRPAARLDVQRGLQALLADAARDGRIPSPPAAGPTAVVVTAGPTPAPSPADDSTN